MHRLDRMHGIPAVPSRWPKTEFCAQSIKKIRAWLFPDTHRAIALHVAMTTHRAQTRAGLSHLSAQQHQVDDLLDIGDSILMLSQAHGPAKDYPLGLDKDSRGIFDFDFRDSRLLKDIAPMAAAKRRLELFKPRRMAIYEFMIQYATWPALFSVEQFFHDSFQQSYVAIDPDLQKKISQLGALAQPGPNFLRMFEARQPSLRQRIDVHDFAAAPLCLHQRSQHARVIGSWILTNDKDRVSQIKVGQGNCAFAEPQGFLHSRAAGFVTHVRAVRQIVGAKLAHEQLIQEGGFVTGPARGVKDRL